MNPSNPAASIPVRTVQVAIYTRKSTEEGLEREFNSLDAQREAGEAYIASQRSQGWVLVEERFDDPGYSGANLQRPAMERLLAAVRAGQVNCVVVYKVDRLSRSLLDFARIMAVLDAQGASFVSVTQQFNTTTSLGRLTLNILLSFAAFERDLVGERTRDKMWAAKKKGKWVGGYPPLGYDVAAGGGRLVVNQTEAERVRWIFTQTVKLGGLRPALAAIQARRWRTKSWRTGAGEVREGIAFSAAGLGRLLRNPVYRGAVNWHGKLAVGEHEPIIEVELWERVNTMLAAPPGTGPRRYRAEAPLRELLYCAACQSPMVATSTRRKGRQYRYYVCLRAQKQGGARCSGNALRAREIEEAVWRQIGERGLAPAADGENGQRLSALVERIEYDGRQGSVKVWLRAGKDAVVEVCR